MNSVFTIKTLLDDDKSWKLFKKVSLILTHLTASAAHSSSILLCGLDSSIGTSAGVFCKAEVVVWAHIDDFLHHFACVPERDIECQRQRIGTLFLGSQ